MQSRDTQADISENEANQRARARVNEPKRNYDLAATGGVMPRALDGQIFDTQADCARHNREAESNYALWWNEITRADLCFARRLTELGTIAGNVAKGKFGRVSSTSVLEAEASARFAVIRFVSRKTKHKRTYVQHEDLALQTPVTLRTLKRIAIAAGTKSLLGDLVVGQRGDSKELKGIRREAIEFLDSLMRGAEVRHGITSRHGEEDEPDSIQLSRSAELALDLVRAVRRVRSIPRNVKPNIRKIKLRRYRRVAIVLSQIAQGHTLREACDKAGFSWQVNRNRSRAWEIAYRETGLHQALTVATGQKIGSVLSERYPIYRALQRSGKLRFTWFAPLPASLTVHPKGFIPPLADRPAPKPIAAIEWPTLPIMPIANHRSPRPALATASAELLLCVKYQSDS